MIEAGLNYIVYLILKYLDRWSNCHDQSCSSYCVGLSEEIFKNKIDLFISRKFTQT
jgi:hypothetical protein